MTLKDILPSYPIDRIMVRTNYPDEVDELSKAERSLGMLFGYCAWDGENLESLDGDTYSVNMEIEKYEVSDHGLVVWFLSDWV